MIRAYLANPWQSAVFAALFVVGWIASRTFGPWAFAVAAVFFAACEIEAGLRKREGPRFWPSEWPRKAAPVTVLYDGHCALCAASKRKLEQWATAGSMRFVTIQSPEARVLAPGLSEEKLLGAMHVVENGHVTSGADGWYRLMRLAPLTTAWLAWILPRAVARPLYGWVARNRYRWFGRTCDDGNCAVHARR
jgi:predicted DCC family thiol-disulfide oxidoreductase YuxK